MEEKNVEHRSGAEQGNRDTLYNVTLQYADGTYNKINEEVSERFLSDGFGGPLRNDVLTSFLAEFLRPIFRSTTVTDEERMKGMTQEFTRLAMASAGISANTTGPSLWQTQLQTQILGRYPIIPVVLLSIVLFLNTLFALVICVATSFSHTGSIRVPGKTGSKSVPLLDLVRLRLVSPAALVSDRFPLARSSVNLTRAEIQAMRDTLDMFCEDKVDRRVRVGMHEDKESGEWVFGTWVRGIAQ